MPKLKPTFSHSVAPTVQILDTSTAEAAVASELERLQVAADYLKRVQPLNYKYILPLLFNLKGEPYTLENQFPFEPMFNRVMPLSQLWITGRQTGKTVSLSASSITRALVIDDYTILLVAPLF